jgi:DNA-binding GntR family transcriptional regulator
LLSLLVLPRSVVYRDVPDVIDALEQLHQSLCDAQVREDWPETIRAGCELHFRLYEASGMRELVKLLEQIWLRTAPLLNLLYRYAPYRNPGRHFHLALIDALRARDAAAVRKALEDDLVKGGHRRLSGHLSMISHTKQAVASTEIAASF